MLPIEVRLYCALSLLLMPINFIVIMIQNLGTPDFLKIPKVFVEVQYFHLYGLITGKHHPTIKKEQPPNDQPN